MYFRANLVAIVLFAVATVAPASARADFVTHPLLTGPGTMSGFTGQEHFYSTGIAANIPNAILDITIDFAVFAPGQYTGTFNALPGFIAPTGSNYIYAYQVHNNGPLHGSGNRVFSKLGLSTTGATVTSVGRDLNYDPSTLDVSPTLAAVAGGGVTYIFITPNIAPDKFSMILLLASPHAPAFGRATVLDSGLSDDGQLPTPSPVAVPAPGAALLGALGLAMLRSVRQRIA